MIPRFSVETECPTCGAPLDFTEGSNAVQCRHCRSNLLITGRKQVLSYYVSPRIDIHRAVAKGVSALGTDNEYRVIKPQLYFVPYYSLAGHELNWQRKPEEEKARPGDDWSRWSGGGGDQDFGESPVTFSSLFAIAGELFGRLFRGRGSEEPAGDAAYPGESGPASCGGEMAKAQRLPEGTGLIPQKDLDLHDRYVGKSFLALNLTDSGMYSLGVRPGVLRLELFRRDAIEPFGKVVAPDLTPETALARGLKDTSSPGLLFRTIIGRILSLIYFPFWVVEVASRGERSLVILDGATGSAVRQGAPLSLYDSFDRELRETSAIISFRQLACPNCGWDLPLRPDEVIFFCSSCRKAWQIFGSRLSEVNYRTVKDESPGKDRVQHLPFWEMRNHGDSDDSQGLLIPAFRYRRLKHLVDLAMEMTGRRAVSSSSEWAGDEYAGCYYDQEDAALFAQFVTAGLSLKAVPHHLKPSESSFAPDAALLIWLPFVVRGNSLFEPGTGTMLSQNLLV